MAVPTMTNNSPAPGSIAWGSFTIQLYGVAYAVSAGSTNQRWVWWEYKNGAPIINAGVAVPDTLTDDDLVLFANKNGIGVRVQSTSFIDGELLVDGSIFAEALSANLINSNHIATVGLDAAVIKFGEMSGDRILADTITANEIAGRTITAAEILGDTITANEIATDAITANEIAGHTITAAEIFADTITSNEIAANAITATEIFAGAITSVKLSSTALDSRLIIGSEIFGGKITTDDPLTEGVQMVMEEYTSTEFSKSGALRFVTGESGVLDGILLGQRLTNFMGNPNDVSRTLLLRPPGAPSSTVGSMEKPSLSLAQRSGSLTDPAVPPAGSGSSAGMFGPIVDIMARPSVIGSGTTVDGGLLLYTHAGAGGNPEARLRLGAKIAHIHTKDTSGTFRERFFVDTVQSRLISPDGLDYFGVRDTGTQGYVNNLERLRVNDVESLMFSPDQLQYMMVNNTGVVLSGPTRLGGGSWPHAIRRRLTTQSIPNTTFTAVNTNVAEELSGGITYSAGTWTVPWSGRYMCSCYAQWVGNANGRRLMQLVRNGTPVVRNDNGAVAAANVTSSNISVPMRFTAGDTLEFQVWQNTGGPLDLNGIANENVVTTISWLGT